METFTTWLERERNRRGWSISEFARQAGLKPGSMNHIINGGRQPGIDACIGIAKALRVSIDEVVRRARPDAMPPRTGDVEDDLLYQLRNLSPDGQSKVAEYARFVQYQGDLVAAPRVLHEPTPEYRVNPPIIQLFAELDDYQQELILEQMRAWIEMKRRRVEAQTREKTNDERRTKGKQEESS